MAHYSSQKEAIDNLEVGDIVLSHKHQGLKQRIIRAASGGSFWNHLSMVFDVVDVEGVKDVILIESDVEGVQIHRLHRYLREHDAFTLGFKRLPGLTELEKERIRGFFLDALDTPYNYRSAFAWTLMQPVAKLLGMRVVDFIERMVIDPSLYICTSFAQRAYYLALPPNQRERAFFIPDNEDAKNLNFLSRMVDITPIDIARSENTVWLWGEHY